MSVEVKSDATSTSHDDGAAESCPACAGPLLGAYCHRCGEERLDRDHLTLRRFAGKAAQELLDIEHSKVFRTSAALLFRPGFLTNEFLAGRKSLYVSPLKVVLVTFGLYFFLYTFYRPVAVYDVRTMIDNDWSGTWAKMIGEMAAEKRLTVDAFIAEVNEKWQGYMSLLQLSNVVFCAALLKLLYVFARRYFVEHFVFSLHYFSFTYVLPVVFWPIYLYTGVGVSRAGLAFSAFVILVILAYLFVALRAVYRQPAAITLLKTVILYLGSYLITAALMLVTLVMAFAHLFLAG